MESGLALLSRAREAAQVQQADQDVLSGVLVHEGCLPAAAHGAVSNSCSLKLHILDGVARSWTSWMPTSRIRTTRHRSPRSAIRASASSRRLPTHRHAMHPMHLTHVRSHFRMYTSRRKQKSLASHGAEEVLSRQRRRGQMCRGARRGHICHDALMR